LPLLQPANGHLHRRLSVLLHHVSLLVQLSLVFTLSILPKILLALLVEAFFVGVTTFIFLS
jgi:hypothetical protein